MALDTQNEISMKTQTMGAVVLIIGLAVLGGTAKADPTQEPISHATNTSIEKPAVDAMRIEFFLDAGESMTRVNLVAAAPDSKKAGDDDAEMKNIQRVLEKAARIEKHLAGQWPKCRFHTASIAPTKDDSASSAQVPVFMAQPRFASRIVLLGESGCLSRK